MHSFVVSPGLPSSRTGRPFTNRVSTTMCVDDTSDSELHEHNKIHGGTSIGRKLQVQTMTREGTKSCEPRKNFK